MYDSLGVLQASTTVSATYNSAWYSMTGITEDDGLTVACHTTAHSAATPGSTCQYSLQYSVDGTNSLGTLWTSPVTMTPGTTPTNILGGVGYFEQAGTFVTPIVTQTSPGTLFVRVVVTFASTTSAPLLTFDAELQWGGRNG